jgi:DMSO/TMAO reductase YedYZ molybdopterin-dependent catalytic subunit
MSTPPPTPQGEPAWLHSHPHEPNPAPSTTDTTLTLLRPDGTVVSLTVEDLGRLPQQSVPNCMIISTGHSATGPFRFEGVSLQDLLTANAVIHYECVDVVSADNFGTRLMAQEIGLNASRPLLLATACNGAPLTRSEGLVRLIVPHETDDALRQVKWIARIEIH